MPAAWHKYSGRAAVCLGLINCFFGIQQIVRACLRASAPNGSLAPVDGCPVVAAAPLQDVVHRTSGPAFIIYSIWVAGLVTFWIGMTLAGKPGRENPSPVAAFAHRVVTCGSATAGSGAGKHLEDPAAGKLTDVEARAAPQASATAEVKEEGAPASGPVGL